jgi:DNA-3-methyladenine glycosylase
VTVALGIGAAQNTRPLFRRPLTIEQAGYRAGPVAWGPRIGISRGTDRPWRCWVDGHASVSRG